MKKIGDIKKQDLENLSFEDIAAVKKRAIDSLLTIATVLESMIQTYDDKTLPTEEANFSRQLIKGLVLIIRCLEAQMKLVSPSVRKDMNAERARLASLIEELTVVKNVPDVRLLPILTGTRDKKSLSEVLLGLRRYKAPKAKKAA